MDEGTRNCLCSLATTTKWIEAQLLDLFKVGRTLDLADDVVPLGEKGDPVVQDALLLVVEVLPLGGHVLGLGGRLGQCPRSVLASEY